MVIEVWCNNEEVVGVMELVVLGDEMVVVVVDIWVDIGESVGMRKEMERGWEVSSDGGEVGNGFEKGMVKLGFRR